MKIAIFGVGAIGSVLSFKLNPLHEAYYYNRSGKSEIRIAENEKIKSKKIELSVAGRKVDLDWLVICLKEYHYNGAEEQLKCLIDAHTKVAVVRNGVNLKEPILKYTTEENILECMIDCPTQITEEGIYRQLRKPIVTVSKNQLSNDFLELFSLEKITIQQVHDFKTANWKKLIESSSLGGVLALSGESCWIFKDEELVSLYERLVEEGINVAKAEGANIEDDFKLELIDKLKKYPASKESSMLIDRRKGNPIELNAKNGVISKLGKKHKIKTELNDLVSVLLKYTNISRPLNS